MNKITLSFSPPARLNNSDQHVERLDDGAETKAVNSELSISPELAVLLSSELRIAHSRMTPLIRGRNEGVRRDQLDKSSEVGTDAQNLHGATTFRYAGHGQSSEGDGGESDGGNKKFLARISSDSDGEFEMNSTVNEFDQRSHLIYRAADLQRNCEKHMLMYGRGAMLPYLRNKMVELLPHFVRDLGDRVSYLVDNALELNRIHLVKPIADACNQFLGVMRPLYSAYVDGPYLLADVRKTLCDAQALLFKEMNTRSDPRGKLKKMMVDTVQPLMAIIVLSVLPRPRQQAVCNMEASVPSNGKDL